MKFRLLGRDHWRRRLSIAGGDGEDPSVVGLRIDVPSNLRRILRKRSHGEERTPLGHGLEDRLQLPGDGFLVRLTQKRLNEAAFTGYKTCPGSKPAKDFAVGQPFFAHTREISIAGLRVRHTMMAHRTGRAPCFQELPDAECPRRENCGIGAQNGRRWGTP